MNFINRKIEDEYSNFKEYTLPMFLKLAKDKSEYNRVRYEHLISQGFTEEQAVEIVKYDKTPFDVNILK